MDHKEKIIRETIDHWRRLRYFCKPGSDKHNALLRLEKYDQEQLELWLKIKENYHAKRHHQ